MQNWKDMNKEEFLEVISENISNIFEKYQDANRIKAGDISPEDDLRLTEIKNSLADLITGSCELNEKTDNALMYLWEVTGIDDLEGKVFAQCTTKEKAHEAKNLAEANGFEDMLEVRKSCIPVDAVVIDGEIIQIKMPNLVKHNSEKKTNETLKFVEWCLQMGYIINFDWLLEDTEENRKKIIEACIELFEAAKGKSATEKKIEHVMKVAKEKGIKVVSEIPVGWNKNPFATDPYGAVTIDNGKPIFVNHKRNPEYQRMFLI